MKYSIENLATKFNDHSIKAEESKKQWIKQFQENYPAIDVTHYVVLPYPVLDLEAE